MVAPCLRCLPLCLLALLCLPVFSFAQLENGPWCKAMGTENSGASSAPGSTGRVIRWNAGGRQSDTASAAVGSNNVVYSGGTQGLTASDGAEGTILWESTPPNLDNVNSTPAIGADGTVYVGDSSPGAGNLYAFDGTTGAIKWSVATDSLDAINSSPAIGSDGTIYVGCDDGKLYAFDSTNGGAKKWEFTTGGAISASPAIDNGLICFGSTDGIFYALNSNGTLNWSYNQGSGEPYSASAAIDSNGSIYVVMDYVGLVCLSHYGAELWLNTDGAHHGTTPAVEGGFAYYVCHTNIDADTIEQVFSNSGGFRNSFVLSGALTFTTSPSMAGDGTIYLGSSNNELFTLNSSTVLEFAAMMPAQVSSTPAIGADGAVFFALSNGTMLAVDNNTVKNAYASPALVVGGTGTRGVVQLSGKAGPHGESVTLSSATVGVPASVTVPANSTGVSFAITTSAVAAATSASFTATLYSSHMTASLTLEPSPISKVYASPDSVLGGVGTHGVVQLVDAAVAPGDVVSLQSGSSDMTVPATATVPAGSKGVSFAITTSLVSALENVTLTATLGTSTQQGTVTINPYPLSTFYVSPTSVNQGDSTTGVVQVTGPAGPSGDVVSVQSSDPSVTVPATVTIPGGSKGVSFKITTGPVSSSTSVTLSVSFAGVGDDATLTVNPATISNFYTSPSSVTGGVSSHGVVQLNGKAGPSGDVINLQSLDAHVVVPPTVTVPAGSTGVSFAITTHAVTTATPVTIQASFGASSSSATITLNP